MATGKEEFIAPLNKGVRHFFSHGSPRLARQTYRVFTSTSTVARQGRIMPFPSDPEGNCGWITEAVMAGEYGGVDRPGRVSRIESLGRPVQPEDVWNAAIRAGVDPARMALSLCHVLGEVTLAELVAGAEDEPATVRFTLISGEAVEYDAGLHNPFRFALTPQPPLPGGEGE